MSAKIGVLESHQNLTESPSRRVKKAIALYLVRQAIAEWVNKGVIQLRPLREYSTGQPLPIITQAEQFDYDYPDYSIPKRKFWRQNLLLHYPHKNQESQRPEQTSHRLPGPNAQRGEARQRWRGILTGV